MATEAKHERKINSPPVGLNGTMALDRESLLNILAETIRTTHLKITNGRIRDTQKEKIRLETVRILGYLSSVYSGILKDRDLTSIEARLTALEERNGDN
jgi:hypothetical protein